MRFIFALLAAFIVSCAEPGRTAHTVEWVKPGATPADFDRDNGVCVNQADAAKRRMIGGRDAVRAHNRVLLDCMRARGWQRPSDFSEAD